MLLRCRLPWELIYHCFPFCRLLASFENPFQTPKAEWTPESINYSNLLFSPLQKHQTSELVQNRLGLPAMSPDSVRIGLRHGMWLLRSPGTSRRIMFSLIILMFSISEDTVLDERRSNVIWYNSCYCVSSFFRIAREQLRNLGAWWRYEFLLTLAKSCFPKVCTIVKRKNPWAFIRMFCSIFARHQFNAYPALSQSEFISQLIASNSPYRLHVWEQSEFCKILCLWMRIRTICWTRDHCAI